jgi:hypothetical protein
MGYLLNINGDTYLFVYLQVVAMMQVGNLPLPLPILTPALHADFPPVHIGIKVSFHFAHFLLHLNFHHIRRSSTTE